MKLACIDVGSNTVRLLISEVNNRGKLKRLNTKRVVTHLGSALSETKALNITGKNLTVKALSKFIDLSKKYNVSHIYAVGTSALRESKDGQEFVDTIRKLLDINIEIISGQREAQLTYEGIKASLDNVDHTLILDIGGGSTECVYMEGEKIMHTSIPIGAIKLYDLFIKKDPPSKEEIIDAKTYVLTKLSNSKLAIDKPFKKELLATGGTATTLATIDLEINRYNGQKVHLHRLTRQRVLHIFKQLINTPFKERLKLKGLEKKRAKIIITGLLILIEIMDFTKSKALTISDYGLLEGLMFEKSLEANSFSTHRT
ncbi:MAG TPA: hypothetical protein HPP56_07855 [Nitrospirae bacterium]|nr:hypothetical protein [Nitrospirota bacterium]